MGNEPGIPLRDGILSGVLPFLFPAEVMPRVGNEPRYALRDLGSRGSLIVVPSFPAEKQKGMENHLMVLPSTPQPLLLGQSGFFLDAGKSSCSRVLGPLHFFILFIMAKLFRDTKVIVPSVSCVVGVWDWLCFPFQ